MGAWNGLALQGELSALLSDESSSFKARVSNWIRDIEMDICTRYHWSFLRAKGQKIMVAGQEEQSLLMDAPNAPDIAISAGGSLSGNSYSVMVTFYEAISKVESQASVATSTVGTTVDNKTIELTNIPLGTEPLTTGRKIYLKSDTDDNYFLAGTISNNIDTAFTITADTTSKIEAPDFGYIHKIDGELFIENKWQLSADSIQTMRRAYSQKFSDTSGSPFTYGTIDSDRVLVYNAPDEADTLSFYYFKLPMGIYPSVDSVPTIPIKLKQVLVAGVEWKGYQYRDRSGKDTNEKRYEMLLEKAISNYGSSDRHSYIIRDVTGNSDGYLIN